MRGRFMLFICDKVLNARYLKKGTLWNIKIKIPKIKFYDKKVDVMSLRSNRFRRL